MFAIQITGRTVPITMCYSCLTYPASLLKENKVQKAFFDRLFKYPANTTVFINSFFKHLKKKIKQSLNSNSTTCGCSIDEMKD